MKLSNEKTDFSYKNKENISIEAKLFSVIEEWEQYKEKADLSIRSSWTFGQSFGCGPRDALKTSGNSPQLVFKKKPQIQRKLSAFHNSGLLEKVEKCKVDLCNDISFRRNSFEVYKKRK